MTTKERIKACIEANRVCDAAPADLWKKAFKMRPRESHKELGPASFRSSNNVTELDLIRSRIDHQQRTMYDMDAGMT